MITLKTLPHATPQEVFDQVALHLLQQGKPATDHMGRCVYRTVEGLKCAAGCLVGDDEYSIKMDKRGGPEGNSWGSLVKDSRVPEHNATFMLITQLQMAHDNASTMSKGFVDYWGSALNIIAHDFKLNNDVINKFFEEKV